MTELFKLVGMIVEVIIEGVKNKESDEEILKRITAPGGVGSDLLKSVRARGDKFDDYIKNG